MISSRSPYSSVTSEQDTRDEERYQARRHADNLKQMRREIARLHRQRELAQLAAVQIKRDQWKAASARYYERHPEVKEKKRQKMAEQRAAKKLAKRRWDPPKIPKKTKSFGVVPDARTLSAQPRTRQQQQLGEFAERPDIDLSPDEHDWLAASVYEVIQRGRSSRLAFRGGFLGRLDQSTHSNPPWPSPRPRAGGSRVAPFLSAELSDAPAAIPLPDLSPAPSRQQPEAEPGSHGRRMVEDTWGVLAPDYDSSDND
ncbi:hypothetical protein B0H13DRAFT_2353751 [Mycena leptocephala]|nr:hypothetical protein B0H13DRAFT_2353751 [Mycena leptocephala]